jgi:hypothetical protein
MTRTHGEGAVFARASATPLRQWLDVPLRLARKQTGAVLRRHRRRRVLASQLSYEPGAPTTRGCGLLLAATCRQSFGARDARPSPAPNQPAVFLLPEVNEPQGGFEHADVAFVNIRGTFANQHRL